jgi:hypothetical protein
MVLGLVLDHHPAQVYIEHLVRVVDRVQTAHAATSLASDGLAQVEGEMAHASRGAVRGAEPAI